MPDLIRFEEPAASDAALLGGKGLSLARMTAAGLPVPPGFVLTTVAYRRLHAAGVRSDPELVRQILEAAHRLGGPVAVRSSATFEDGSEASFAGQQETILGVRGDEQLLTAIESCWRSLHSERAAAYRRQRNIPDAGLAMAVVVQQLVPAAVAGVLFTRDPHDPTGRLMSVEAAWGLGEVVVSGRVTPDRFRLDRDSGAVFERHAGRKTIRIIATGEEPVPPDQVEACCLTDADLARLAELGRQVEAFYGDARDIEWAFAEGTFHLLQARPITANSAREREAIRAEVIAGLRALADPRGTVWVRYNLSEVLAEPTPMTWAAVGRLLAADGGFGAMNRDLGATPDPALGSQSAFDLVAGRPMCNLSRLPRLQFTKPPIEYPFARLKADPRQALEPKPVLNPVRDGLRAWLRLPITIWRLFRVSSSTYRIAGTFAAEFPKRAADFAEEARSVLAQDWSQRTPQELKSTFDAWVRKTLVDFARDSLKATVLADLAWARVVELLKGRVGEERARTAVGELALGAKPPDAANLAEAVRRLAAKELERAAFVEQFGHRAQNEMELAQPRWAEDPAAVDRLVRSTRTGESGSMHALGQAIAALGIEPESPGEVWNRIAAEAKLSGLARSAADTWVERLRTFLGLRESAKHHLLLGYAVIRRALVELDRRFQLQGGIFYLLPGELDELLAHGDVSRRIAERRTRRTLELSLEVPAVLFSDDLEAIGRPLPPPEGATVLEGIALSAGTAEAPALVLTDPTAEPPDSPYVLVCPSTDPAWVPLFAGAAALVMETGGVLSHGAIVAREFGLPAVAGLPTATRLFRTGQRLRVDGARGTVTVMT